MTISYATALKNDRLQKVIDRLDAQAGFATMKLYTAGGATLLSTIVLQKPSFNAPSGGVMSLAGTPLTDLNAAATGVAALARLADSVGTVWADGLTVGTAATDVILGTATINAGDEVLMNSGTITHP